MKQASDTVAVVRVLSLKVAFFQGGRYSLAMNDAVRPRCTTTGITKRIISMSITDTGIICWPAGPGVC